MNWPIFEFPRQRKKLLSLFLVLGMGDCLAALDDFSEKSIIQDVPVVLSASRLRQPPSEAPNAVTVIDRAMIKASGFRTVVDLLKLAPGMYVDYFNGHMPIVSYRGATDEYTRRMQVLVDGRSVYLPPLNTVNWEDLPLHVDDIERIEVVRGPAATSYGSNSIMGVINITTRDASALKGASLSATKGNAGNAGISDIAAHFGKSGEHLDYRVTLGMRSDNGFNFPADSPEYFSGYNDSSATHFASLRSNYRPNGIDSLDFQLGYSNGVGAYGDPRSVLTQPRNIAKSLGYQQLTWVRTLDQGDEIRSHYYHISRNSVSEAISSPIAGVSYWISDNTKAHRHELELQHTVHTGPNNRLVWGAATRHDSVDAPATFLAPQSLRQYRLFAHDEWRIMSPLMLNAGAMLEDDGLGNRKTSPRAALNYHLTPEHTLRTSISVAYRTPSLAEERSNRRFWVGTLVQNWLASGGLRPERTLSREIGYIGKLGNGLSIDVRAYNDQVSDIIGLDASFTPGTMTASTWDFRNEFAAHYTGLEGTVKYNWDTGSVTFNYAHQMVSAVLLGTPRIPAYLPVFLDIAHNLTNSVPLNSGSLLFVRQMNDGWSLSLGYYQQGTVRVPVAPRAQPLARRLDMRVAKQFGAARAGSKNIGGGEAALVIQNALQDNNVGYSGYLFDRRAYLTATVNF